MKDTRKFKWEYHNAEYPNGHAIPKNGSAYLFKNIGNDEVRLNGYPFPSGESIGLPGLEGELDATDYKIDFVNGAGNVGVWIKIYIS